MEESLSELQLIRFFLCSLLINQNAINNESAFEASTKK